MEGSLAIEDPVRFEKYREWKVKVTEGEIDRAPTPPRPPVLGDVIEEPDQTVPELIKKKLKRDPIEVDSKTGEELDQVE